MESRVAFLAVDMPHANKLTMHLLTAVAEHEREMISQRTKAALAAVKIRGTRLGNPRPDMATARAAASGNAARFRAAIRPQIQGLQVEGRSLRGIAAELNAKGINGLRRGSWHATSVRTVLQDVSYGIYKIEQSSVD